MSNEIPPMTDPMGKYWRQPPVSEILIDENNAVMTESVMNALSEYSSTLPSGVYPGKMWRAHISGIWFLRWYGEHSNPKLCSNNQREILIA